MRKMQKIVYFTPIGLAEKKKEYENLLTSRSDAVRELAKAREMGDLSENGYYKSARFKLSDIDRQLRHLKQLIKVARIKESSHSGIVEIGSTVILSDGENQKTYEIVGTYESNPSLGKISHLSPFGSMLMGKKKNDTVSWQQGENIKTFTILKIK